MTIANHETDGRDHPSETPTIQAQGRYCSFRIPSPSTVRCSWWSKIRTRGTGAFNKIREWSELVAGPRWKTFVRRFKRNRTGSTARTFRYDPLSYALNFDDGPSQDEEDGYYERNFSSRYAKAKAGGGGGVGSTFV